MPDPSQSPRPLRQLDADFKNTITRISGPRSSSIRQLESHFATRSPPPCAGSERPAGAPVRGAGTTSFSVMLTSTSPPTSPGLAARICRTWTTSQTTQRIAYFHHPRGDPKNQPKKLHSRRSGLSGVPPVRRIMESPKSARAVQFRRQPLRASVAMTLSQQKITEFKFNQTNDAPGVRAAAATAGQLSYGGAAGSRCRHSLLQPGSAELQQIAAPMESRNPRMCSPAVIDLNPPSASLSFGTLRSDYGSDNRRNRMTRQRLPPPARARRAAGAGAADSAEGNRKDDRRHAERARRALDL